MEYFLKILKVEDIIGNGIFDTIVNEIKNVGLDLVYIKGQGYDNEFKYER